jgi:tetratricopeptide (TPR) repeat protein
LAIFKEALAPDHPFTSQAMTSLAAVYIRAADFEKALPLATSALEIAEKTLPADHPNVAIALNAVGLIQYTRKEYARAAEYLSRAAQIMQKQRGADDPQALLFKQTLAFVKRDAGQFDEATRLFKEVIDGLHRIKAHSQAVQVEVGMLEGMIWQGKYAEAEPVANHTLAEASRLGDPAARAKLVSDTLMLTIQLYDAWQKPDEAAEARRKLQAVVRPESASTVPTSQP